MPDIAMWGATGSGKTTFIYALSIALAGEPYGYTMAPDDDASEVVLIKATAALADERTFPEATQGIDYLQFSLFGRRQRTVPNGKTLRLEDSPNRITLKLVDPSGELIRPDSTAGPDRKRLIDELVDANGIIFIIDPISEFERGDAFASTSGLLQQLTRQVASTDPNFDGRLPHHIAICVTKFDEPRILATADKLNLLRYDRNDKFRFPRVDDSDAQQLLTSLSSVSPSGYGDRMLNSLARHFYPERVRYFITSAVGFYVSPDIGRYDKYDPQNLVKTKPGFATSGTSRIRGPLHPINIVEPVLWLGEQEPRR